MPKNNLKKIAIIYFFKYENLTQLTFISRMKSKLYYCLGTKNKRNIV